MLDARTNSFLQNIAFLLLEVKIAKKFYPGDFYGL